MFKRGSIQSHLNLKDKILAMDFILLSCIIILGLISFFAMYSTDGGEFAYHTKSHIIRFFVFFLLFFAASFLISAHAAIWKLLKYFWELLKYISAIFPHPIIPTFINHL